MKKNNKKSKLYVFLCIVLTLLLIAVLSCFVFQLLNLNVLPFNIMISIIAILVLISLIFLILMDFSCRRIWSRFISVIIVISFITILAAGNVYIYKTQSVLEKVTAKQSNEGKVKNVVSVICLNGSSIEKIEDLENLNIGSLNTIDSKGTKECLKELNKVDFENKKYDSVQQEVNALYENEVDAIILNECYRQNVTEFEDCDNFDNETKVIHSVTYYTDEKNEALVVSDITSNPFTILISGSDNYGEIDTVARTDVNMVVTINPVTSTVLMVSIPRDLYIDTICTDYACSYGAKDKLTHTGIYGIQTTKDTIENLLDIDINYTYRVNFSSLVEIVDALEGIDVLVPEGMAVERLFADGVSSVHEGWNHMDGKTALAYARERHAYLDGDLQRARNQQQVLEAIVDKASSSTALKNYSKLLKAMSNVFETNMAVSEITDLIKYELQSLPNWKFESYVIRGYGSMEFCAALGSEASVLIPDLSTVDIASLKIKAVINGESSESIVDENEQESAGLDPNYDFEYESALVNGTVYYPSN